ncbi:MAG: tRNA pseudouridine(38-40) synthase TruA [Haliscomenobacter sp.]
MQRYFIELAYKGTRFSGWQRQPHAPSIQQTLEETFSRVLGYPLQLTGCGRTDAGVHARHYIAHADFQEAIPDDLLHRINRMLPIDIALYRAIPVHPEAHARFDATSRTYHYIIQFRKNPFSSETTYQYPFRERPDVHRLQAATTLLLNYREFLPFCKSNHDALTMQCVLSRADWTIDPSGDQAVFSITANRFLRGMVRLIVGMAIQVGLGKIQLDEVREALDCQQPLQKSLSAPPQGLFLTDICYPYLPQEDYIRPPLVFDPMLVNFTR